MNLLELMLDQKLLNDYVENSHYADIAEELEVLDIEMQYQFYNLVGSVDFANILIEFNTDNIIKVVDFFDVLDLIKIVLELRSDDAVDVIGYADFGKQKAILNSMKQNDKDQYNMLLGYEKDSAGGLMSTEYVALRSSLTVEYALTKLREIESYSDNYIDILYIVDEKRKLQGIVNLKRLILANPEVIIRDLMNTSIISVKASEDQEEVADLVQKYNLYAIPVVNNLGNILGIITVDDVIDVLIEEQSEDILLLGGVVDNPETEDTVVSFIKARLPWLCINLFTAFLASFVVSSFDDVIDQVVALAVAMPIVAGMGGNAGTQALSVMIRNITINDASIATEWKKAYREVLVGGFNGFVIGIGAGLILSILYGNFYLGLILLLAMMGNLIVAGIVGSFVPLILKKLNFDPALASSIFITTATDIFGFFLFLGLASLFINYL